MSKNTIQENKKNIKINTSQNLGIPINGNVDFMPEYSIISTNKDFLTSSTLEDYHLLITELENIFVKKNKTYGNSFFDTLEEYGNISLLTRLTDKFNRLKQLILYNKEEYDESLEDTMLDMANYLIMGVIHLRRGK